MKYLSFKQKLFLMGVIPIVTLGLLIGSFTFQDAKRIVTNSHKAVIADTVYRIDMNMNLKVRYITESIRAAAQDRLARELVESYDAGGVSAQLLSEMEAYCGSMTRGFGAISTISVIAGDQLLYSTGGDQTLNRTVAGKYRVQAEKDPDKIYWTSLGPSMFLSRKSQDWNMLAAYGAIRGENDQVIGILVVEFMPSSFSNLLLRNQEILSYQHTFIVDRSDRLICADTSQHPAYYSLIERTFNEGTRRFEFTWNGEQYYACGQYNGLTGWKTFSVISVRSLFAGADALREHIEVLLLRAVLLMLLAIFFMYRSFTRPLSDLEQAMGAVQEGRFGLQIKNGRRDEIGRLIDSFNYMSNKIDLLIQEVYEGRLAQKNAEIEALQAQINPHFLYNTLDSINWMLIDRGENDISEIVVSLGKLMQYCVDTGDALVTLEQECQYVQDYLRIQKNRLEDRLQYSLEIEESIRSLRVPKLILQPLVENSIRHAIEPFQREGFISIRAWTQNGRAEIAVSDNGCGMSQAQILALTQPAGQEEGRTGIGVRNVARRLKLFFGEESGLVIESRPDAGTRVTIVIPLKTKGELDEHSHH